MVFLVVIPPPCFGSVNNKGGNNYKKSEKYPKIAYFLARLRRAFLIISLIFELFDHFLRQLSYLFGLD